MDYFTDSRVLAAEARHRERRRRAGTIYGIVDRVFFLALLALAILIIGLFARMVLPHIFGPTPVEGQVLSPSLSAEGGSALTAGIPFERRSGPASISRLASPSGTGSAKGDLPPAGEGLPLFRESGTVAVLARATDRWSWVPTDAHDLLGDYRFLPPYATQDTKGQVFELLDAEEGSAPADGEGRFVVVPWTLGCGCADEGWDQPDWVPPGDTVAFLLARTRERMPLSWAGPPVYDVRGWHQPYPTGDFIPFWRTTRERNPDWLSAREFFHLLQTLPTEHAFRLDAAASFRPLLAWLEVKPGRRGAFPVPIILSEWEKRARP
jgi:hypothetical protein